MKKMWPPGLYAFCVALVVSCKFHYSEWSQIHDFESCTSWVQSQDIFCRKSNRGILKKNIYILPLTPKKGKTYGSVRKNEFCHISTTESLIDLFLKNLNWCQACHLKKNDVKRTLDSWRWTFCRLGLSSRYSA